MRLTQPARLFCSEACSQEAALVRYVRRCSNDGRIEQPDVIEAIQIRLTHVINGGYPERERRLPLVKRQAVITHDSGRCRICGGLGTDIDHIKGGSNEMDNLQLVCRTCHNKKTIAGFTHIGPDDEQSEELKSRLESFRRRAESPILTRVCDDEEEWEKCYRKILVERSEFLKRKITEERNEVLKRFISST